MCHRWPQTDSEIRYGDGTGARLNAPLRQGRLERVVGTEVSVGVESGHLRVRFVSNRLDVFESPYEQIKMDGCHDKLPGHFEPVIVGMAGAMADW